MLMETVKTVSSPPKAEEEAGGPSEAVSDDITKKTEEAAASAKQEDEEREDDDGKNEEDVERQSLASTYRDYSHVLPEKAPAPAPSSRNVAGKEPTFPVKLHMILSTPEFSTIISWLPHGRSWRIIQQKAFEERVIPLFFRHGRYSSFARQVNGWGFRRMTHGCDYNSYYHEMFLRGMPHLCEKMRRLTTKDAQARRKLDEEDIPDFYALSRRYPLPESSPVPPITAPSLRATRAGGAIIPHCLPDLESSLLERRQAEMMQRMELLANDRRAADALCDPAVLASMGGFGGFPQNPRAPPLPNSMLSSLAGLGNAGPPPRDARAAGLGGLGNVGNPFLENALLGGGGADYRNQSADSAALRQLLMGGDGRGAAEPDIAQLVAAENAARIARARGGYGGGGGAPPNPYGRFSM